MASSKTHNAAAASLWDDQNGLGWQVWRRLHSIGANRYRKPTAFMNLIGGRALLSEDILRRWGQGPMRTVGPGALNFPLARPPFFRLVSDRLKPHTATGYRSQTAIPVVPSRSPRQSEATQRFPLSLAPSHDAANGNKAVTSTLPGIVLKGKDLLVEGTTRKTAMGSSELPTVVVTGPSKLPTVELHGQTDAAPLQTTAPRAPEDSMLGGRRQRTPQTHAEQPNADTVAISPKNSQGLSVKKSFPEHPSQNRVTGARQPSSSFRQPGTPPWPFGVSLGSRLIANRRIPVKQTISSRKAIPPAANNLNDGTMISRHLRGPIAGNQATTMAVRGSSSRINAVSPPGEVRSAPVDVGPRPSDSLSAALRMPHHGSKIPVEKRSGKAPESDHHDSIVSPERQTRHGLKLLLKGAGTMLYPSRHKRSGNKFETSKPIDAIDGHPIQRKAHSPVRDRSKESTHTRYNADTWSSSLTMGHTLPRLGPSATISLKNLPLATHVLKTTEHKRSHQSTDNQRLNHHTSGWPDDAQEIATSKPNTGTALINRLNPDGTALSPMVASLSPPNTVSWSPSSWMGNPTISRVRLASDAPHRPPPSIQRHIATHTDINSMKSGTSERPTAPDPDTVSASSDPIQLHALPALHPEAHGPVGPFSINRLNGTTRFSNRGTIKQSGGQPPAFCAGRPGDQQGPNNGTRGNRRSTLHSIGINSGRHNSGIQRLPDHRGSIPGPGSANRTRPTRPLITAASPMPLARHLNAIAGPGLIQPRLMTDRGIDRMPAPSGCSDAAAPSVSGKTRSGGRVKGRTNRHSALVQLKPGQTASGPTTAFQSVGRSSTPPAGSQPITATHKINVSEAGVPTTSSAPSPTNVFKTTMPQVPRPKGALIQLKPLASHQHNSSAAGASPVGIPPPSALSSWHVHLGQTDTETANGPSAIRSSRSALPRLKPFNPFTRQGIQRQLDPDGLTAATGQSGMPGIPALSQGKSSASSMLSQLSAPADETQTDATDNTIDTDELASKIWQKIEHKLAIERERRGITQWL